MYDDVLVPTDGSETADRAVDHAVTLASRYGATLHALFVVDVRMTPLDPDEDVERVTDDVRDVAERTVGDVADAAAAADVPAETTIVLGVPHEAVVDHAREHADVVVMGTHGRSGLERAFLGSTTERVLRTLDCPVLAVPP